MGLSKLSFKRGKVQDGDIDGEKAQAISSVPKLLRNANKEYDGKPRPLDDRLSYWLFVGCILLGIVAAGAYTALGVLQAMPKDRFCLVLHDDFSSGQIDPTIWGHEVETGGFGNFEFEWTTTSTNNSYVKDGMLHIVPTLTQEQFGLDALYDGHVLNLTASGDCTAANKTDASCVVVSNRTTGVILPPVQSARLTTNISQAIRYGKVEVRARMPTGDWLWPAIWMMPRESKYGAWPLSGEIDIMESKGNPTKKRSDELANVMKSTLHYGPLAGDSTLDRYYLLTHVRKLWRNFYNQDFHTFGLQWTEDEIFTWEGSPNSRNLQHSFKDQSMWDFGNFELSSTNGTSIHNPWGTNHSAPFDQEFFLILNVAVGGTNGYFQDGLQDGKPWTNSNQNARAEFWANRAKWLPSWPADPSKRGMVIDYVKIWQKC